MDSDLIIRHKTRTCKEWFQICLEVPDMKDDWLEQMSAEFNCWASDLNADKLGPDSLDSRLRLRPDVRDQVADLLDGLVTALNKYEEIGCDRPTRGSEPTHSEDEHPVTDEEGRSLSPWSDMDDSTGSQPNSSAEGNNDKEHLDLYRGQKFYIETNLELLNRIHDDIKRSGHQFINQHADENLIEAEAKYKYERARLGEHAVLYGNDTSIGNHERFRRFLTRRILQNGYTEALIHYIESDIQLFIMTRGANSDDPYVMSQTKLLILFRTYLYDPARLTHIQRRLINANVVRRNRLIYAGSIRKAQTGEGKNPHETLVQKPRRRRKAAQESRAADHKRRLSSPLVQTPSMSKPKRKKRFVSRPATALESHFSITAALSPSQSTESVVTDISATLANIDYPKPDRVRNRESKGFTVHVENIHRDLTEEDLMELFERIGPVINLQLRNDCAGPSKGTADVTYEMKEDAEDALRQIHGANTIGQPIQLTLLSPQGHFNTANREPFPCSYCPLILPHTYTDNARWRAHVVQDLCPYVCIFEDCESPDKMYASTYEWMSHLAKCHSTTEWVCVSCSKLQRSSGNGTSTVSFNDPMDLGKHISAFHQDVASDDTELLIQAGKLPAGIQRIACPLCRRGLVTNETNADGNQGLVHSSNRVQEVGLRQLEEDEHIATHIHEFALHAFPWPNETKTEPDLDLLKSNSTASSRPEITFQASSHTIYFGKKYGFYNPHEILEIVQTLRQELTLLDRSNLTGLLDWIVGEPESVIQSLDCDALAVVLNECRMTISQLQLSKNSHSRNETHEEELVHELQDQTEKLHSLFKNG
ncbi:hypothetical protein H9L39_07952 [Fusarium oxysporum f. sp. albedinis]|nr:hypothetical protein H9L39_07952 [Fusarium oxysporum f. sp. albedinis]